MKKFLEGLLIFFSLALCGLIAFQWVRETHLRQNVQALTDKAHDQAESIQNLQATLKRTEAEVQRLDALKTELTIRVATNLQEIARLRKDLDKATTEHERQLETIARYKEIVDKANENIRKQNEDIKRQNQEMKQLAQERNEVVEKFNKMAADYNDLVKKWNAQQEELSKKESAPQKK